MGRTGTRDHLTVGLTVLLATAATALAVGPPEPDHLAEEQAQAQEQAWWEREPLYAIFALLVGMAVLVIAALVFMARQ